MKNIQPTDIVRVSRSAADFSMPVQLQVEVASVDAVGFFDTNRNFYDFGIWQVELVEARGPRDPSPSGQSFV